MQARITQTELQITVKTFILIYGESVKRLSEEAMAACSAVVSAHATLRNLLIEAEILGPDEANLMDPPHTVDLSSAFERYTEALRHADANEVMPHIYDESIKNLSEEAMAACSAVVSAHATLRDILIEAGLLDSEEKDLMDPPNHNTVDWPAAFERYTEALRHADAKLVTLGQMAVLRVAIDTLKSRLGCDSPGNLCPKFFVYGIDS